MFQGCTALKTAPELPATTITNGCYSSMFSGCTSLVTAPELPARILAEIKCAQPNTVTVPYYPFTLQPNCGCNTQPGCGSCQNQFWY